MEVFPQQACIQKEGFQANIKILPAYDFPQEAGMLFPDYSITAIENWPTD